MRETIAPYRAAIFCVCLSAIALVTNIGTAYMTRTVPVMGSGDIAFLCFMPMCFFQIGTCLAELRNENRELRTRLERFVSLHEAGQTEP